jgi:hypothetical protein
VDERAPDPAPLSGGMTPRDITGAVVLMVLAREPGGRMTGRKQVLATAARSLTAAGAVVRVVALTNDSGPRVWLDCPIERVRPPSLPRTAVGGLVALSTGRSLNEALYDTRRVRRRIAALARASGAQVIVADTLRVWRAAAMTRLPVVAHLDDLLSERYAGMGASGSEAVLGYYGDHLSPWIRRVAEATACRLLAIEARRCGRRELEVARCAAVTALTSAADARRFSVRSRVAIVALPMAAQLMEPVDAAASPDDRALFLGGLDYAPNVRALRWWRDEVLPRVRMRGVHLRLTVVGHATDEHRKEFAGPEIEIRGYVDDLAAAMRGHRLSVVPLQSGAGIKTKVLDAMNAGLPVVSTSAGVTGIPVCDGRHALIADTADEFSDCVVRLVHDATLAAAIGRAGRDLVRSTFSARQIEADWGAAVSTALASAHVMHPSAGTPGRWFE